MCNLQSTLYTLHTVLMNQLFCKVTPRLLDSRCVIPTYSKIANLRHSIFRWKNNLNSTALSHGRPHNYTFNRQISLYRGLSVYYILLLSIIKRKISIKFYFREVYFANFIFTTYLLIFRSKILICFMNIFKINLQI